MSSGPAYEITLDEYFTLFHTIPNIEPLELLANLHHQGYFRANTTVIYDVPVSDSEVTL